jgi:hypothetical protein
MHIKASHPVRSNPPDLRWLTRGIYRVALDPAAESNSTDPWMFVLPARYGEVYPFGAGRLAVEVSDARIAARVAAALGNPPPYTRGWYHWCFLLTVSQLGAVAEIICPPRVRRMSAAAKRRLAGIGKATQFGALDTALNRSSEDQDTRERPEATCGPSVVPGHSGAPLTACARGQEGGR